MNGFLKGMIVASGLFAAATTAAHAEWPERPINLVIPFSPGGGLDQSMLPLKPLLEEKLGQTILFNYKPGAGARIGFETVFLNGADGYTIGALSEPHFSSSTIFDTPKYTIDDMVPLGIISTDVPIWFVRKDSPYQNLNDLIADAKKRPGEIKVAIGSFTGEHYVTMAILEQVAGINLRAVNVQGGSKVMSNIMGGHFDVGISRPGSITSIKDEVRGLGVIAAKRSALFPDAPTFDEQLPDDIRIPHLSSSRGMIVHAKFAEQNPAAFQKLQAAFEEAVHTPEYSAALERMGLELEWVGPEEAKKQIRESAETMTKYKQVVDDAKNRN